MNVSVHRQRNRDREGIGKSAHSWIKHGMANKAVGAQIGAFRWKFPDARMLLIDGNAGDGVGVDLAQPDMFDGDRTSKPTPRLLADLAEQHRGTLCLCEKNRKKRAQLIKLFPRAIVTASHDEAAELAWGFNYVLWLSDPCGPSGHGVEQMRKVALRVLCSDFVVVLNELACVRFSGVTHSPYWQKHQIYTPMREPSWWLRKLPKRCLARSPLIKPSGGFHFRLLVISDFLADGVLRQHNVEIIKRGE